MIDFSINLSAVIQTLAIIGGGLIVYGGLQRTVKRMEQEIIEIKKDQKDIAKALSQIAVQDTRLTRVEEDIRDLRRGIGFIKGPGGIDKEYP